MEVFPIERNGADSFSYIAYGTGSARPVVTERTVAWPTFRGDLNVAALYGARNRAVSYRLKTDGSIVSSPTFKDGRIYTASLDGFVYAIDEKDGSLAWEVSTGEAVTQSPIPFGDRVFAITEDGRMFCFDSQTGRQLWDAPTPHVRKFIAASTNRLYLTNRFGQLISVDSASGAVLNRVDAGDISFVVPNYQTDRLYFGSGRGTIQCLREIASKIPYFHADEIEANANPAAADMNRDKPAIALEDDPFQTLDGQQEESTRKATAADDPFAVPNNAAGNAAKDAGAGAGKVDDDPFK
jgi:hypothetical protein